VTPEPFARYLAKHGHYPTLKLSRGRRAYAANGYIALEQAGHRLYITRADLPKFLKFAHHAAKLMDQTWDPQEAMARAMDEEAVYLREQRRLKKTRYQA
jgi:hypothetical protein